MWKLQVKILSTSPFPGEKRFWWGVRGKITESFWEYLCFCAIKIKKLCPNIFQNFVIPKNSGRK